MSAFVDIVLPVFALLGVGYAAARLGYFDEAATRALSRFVFQFALPVMLFSSLSAQTRPTAFAPSYLVAFYAGVVASAASAALLARALGRQAPRDRVVAGFSACYGNVILLGIPLVLRALGEEASLPLFVLITFHGPILMTLVTILLERGGTEPPKGGRLWSTLKGLAQNPILVGLLGGILFGASGLTLPGPVAASAELLGRSALPAALFAMGAALAAYRIRGAIGLAAGIVLLKTVLHPAVTWLCADYLFAIPRPWSDTVIILAAMPTGINAYLFAARYRSGEAEAASAILLSTAFSLITVSVILSIRLG